MKKIVFAIIYRLFSKYLHCIHIIVTVQFSADV